MSLSKPVLIGFLPPIGGLPKTEEFFDYHKALINTGDIVYALAVTLLSAGKNHLAWNFSARAEVVNEAFSQVVWAIPCRIAGSPFDKDGFPYELATKFIEKLNIPFTSVTESIQSQTYDYIPDFHKTLPPEVVRYLKTIADKSHVVGARGEYSAEVLNKLGIKNVEPIGCPSLYMNGPALHPSLLKKKSFSEVQNVAVTYSNYQLRSASLIREVMSLAASKGYFFVEQTSNIVPKLLYYPGKIEPMDFLRASQCYGGLEYLRALYNANKLRYFTNFGNWKEFLSQMDFVFGARMHGLTPAIQSGVPAHFIAHDSRVREMCEFFRLPFSAERDFTTTGFDVEEIYNRTDYAAATKAYPECYRKFIQFLTANKITANCGENLEILEQLDFSPSPGVGVELNPATNKIVNLRYANELFNIGKAIADQGSVRGYERLVESCCDQWSASLKRNSNPTDDSQYM